MQQTLGCLVCELWNEQQAAESATVSPSHKRHGEIPMTKTILASTVLALLCAGPMTAIAAPSQNADGPAAHVSRVAHQNLADMRAAAPEPPTVFPSRRPQPYPYNF